MRCVGASKVSGSGRHATPISSQSEPPGWALLVSRGSRPTSLRAPSWPWSGRRADQSVNYCPAVISLSTDITSERVGFPFRHARLCTLGIDPPAAGERLAHLDDGVVFLVTNNDGSVGSSSGGEAVWPYQVGDGCPVSDDEAAAFRHLEHTANLGAQHDVAGRVPSVDDRGCPAADGRLRSRVSHQSPDSGRTTSPPPMTMEKQQQLPRPGMIVARRLRVRRTPASTRSSCGAASTVMSSPAACRSVRAWAVR